jgi:hypothetical protein
MSFTKLLGRLITRTVTLAMLPTPPVITELNVRVFVMSCLRQQNGTRLHKIGQKMYGRILGNLIAFLIHRSLSRPFWRTFSKFILRYSLGELEGAVSICVFGYICTI